MYGYLVEESEHAGLDSRHAALSLEDVQKLCSSQRTPVQSCGDFRVGRLYIKVEVSYVITVRLPAQLAVKKVAQQVNVVVGWRVAGAGHSCWVVLVAGHRPHLVEEQHTAHEESISIRFQLCFGRLGICEHRKKKKKKKNKIHMRVVRRNANKDSGALPVLSARFDRRWLSHPRTFTNVSRTWFWSHGGRRTRARDELLPVPDFSSTTSAKLSLTHFIAFFTAPGPIPRRSSAKNERSAKWAVPLIDRYPIASIACSNTLQNTDAK